MIKHQTSGLGVFHTPVHEDRRGEFESLASNIYFTCLFIYFSRVMSLDNIC